MANSSRGRGRWPAPDTCGGCGVAGSAGHRTPLGWPHVNRRRWSTSHAAPTAVRLWPTLLRAFRRLEGFQQPDADELGFNDGWASPASTTGAGQETALDELEKLRSRVDGHVLRLAMRSPCAPRRR